MSEANQVTIAFGVLGVAILVYALVLQCLVHRLNNVICNLRVHLELTKDQLEEAETCLGYIRNLK